MNLYAETALIALAGVGTFTIAAKIHDGLRFLKRKSEVTSTPTCYGEHREGNIAAERDCLRCTYQAACREQTYVNRVAAQCEVPADPYQEFAGTRIKFVDGGYVPYGDPRCGYPETGIPASENKFGGFPDKTPASDAWPTEIKDGRLVEDQPLKQVMPNMGGLDSKVAYAGPNYVSDEELANMMKPVPYYFAPGMEDAPKDHGDLAWAYEFGRVAADGCIWTEPGTRVATGVVKIHWSEMTKAARFGWHYERDADTPGYVWARKDEM